MSKSPGTWRHWFSPNCGLKGSSGTPQRSHSALAAWAAKSLTNQVLGLWRLFLLMNTLFQFLLRFPRSCPSSVSRLHLPHRRFTNPPSGGAAGYSWVGTAYLLTSAACAPLYGVISVCYYRKRALAGIDRVSRISSDANRHCSSPLSCSFSARRSVGLQRALSGCALLVVYRGLVEEVLFRLVGRIRTVLGSGLSITALPNNNIGHQ